MKYPQAYVFFKYGSAVTITDVQSVCGSKMDMELIAAANAINSSIAHRVRLARNIAQSLSDEYLSRGPCLVINTFELNSFFTLKFSSNIQGIVWMTSSKGYTTLRSGLAILKAYWHLLRGIDLSVRNYNRISQVLGQDCPEFKRNQLLFSSLGTYEKSLNSKSIINSMGNRLQKISHFGKYRIE